MDYMKRMTVSCHRKPWLLFAKPTLRTVQDRLNQTCLKHEGTLRITTANHNLWDIQMAIATERITVLVNAKEKIQLASKAKNAGLSMGEFLRCAALSYDPFDDETALEEITDQINKPAGRTCLAIDKTIQFVNASNIRIAAMERKAVRRRKLSGT
jgi:hypothetical protein